VRAHLLSALEEGICERLVGCFEGRIRADVEDDEDRDADVCGLAHFDVGGGCEAVHLSAFVEGDTVYREGGNLGAGGIGTSHVFRFVSKDGSPEDDFGVWGESADLERLGRGGVAEGELRVYGARGVGDVHSLVFGAGVLAKDSFKGCDFRTAHLLTWSGEEVLEVNGRVEFVGGSTRSLGFSRTLAVSDGGVSHDLAWNKVRRHRENWWGDLLLFLPL